MDAGDLKFEEERQSKEDNFKKRSDVSSTTSSAQQAKLRMLTCVLEKVEAYLGSPEAASRGTK